MQASPPNCPYHLIACPATSPNCPSHLIACPLNVTSLQLGTHGYAGQHAQPDV